MKISTDQLPRLYFEWMVSIVMPDFNKRIEYSSLLGALDNSEFLPSMDMDHNRLNDGIGLRYRFGIENGFDRNIILYYLDTRPCSMLEMMCALSLRIEETIMLDPEIGNRTWFWFEEMISSLGLIDQNNRKFNYNKVLFRIGIFNRRQYNPNGQGGLFTIDDPSIDVRTLEIWYQMNLYIKQIDYQENTKIYV